MRRPSRSFLIPVLTMAAVVAAWPQERSLTLQDAIALGRARSAALQSARLRTELAEVRAGEARLARVPSLAVTGSYTRLSDEAPAIIETGPPLNQSIELADPLQNAWTLSATVEQPLFAGLRIESGIRAAGLSARAERAAAGRTERALAYQVREAWWRLVQALDNQDVANENLERVRRHLQDVRNLKNQGLATRSEVLAVEMRLADAELLVIEGENQVRTAGVALAILTGLPADAAVTPAEVSFGQEEAAPGQDEALEQALAARRDLAAATFRIEAADAEVAGARSSFLPSISLHGGYTYARPNPRLFPPPDRFEDTWELGVVARLEIGDWPLAASRTAEARTRVAQLQATRDGLRDAIITEVITRRLAVENARKRIEVAERKLGQARESYRIAQDKFQTGLATSSQLLDSQVDLLQAELDHTRALIDLELAFGALALATGR